MPALDDPGQIKLFPQMQHAGDMFSAVLKHFKKVTLACNPVRISFLGKEIVICRFNFLRRLKQNHHQKIAFAQKKYSGTHPEEKPVDDNYRVAKTILRQSYLLPLPQIVQPTMWSYAMDCLNLTPEPDYLVLADECADYYYRVPLTEA